MNSMLSELVAPDAADHGAVFDVPSREEPDEEEDEDDEADDEDDGTSDGYSE